MQANEVIKNLMAQKEITQTEMREDGDEKPVRCKSGS